MVNAALKTAGNGVTPPRREGPELSKGYAFPVHYSGKRIRVYCRCVCDVCIKLVIEENFCELIRSIKK